MTTTLSRRLEILRLARKYNFIIFEDDPYWYLYYGDAPRPPSYFSLERSTDGDIGRVIRFESFSKIFAAGLRLAWMAGPNDILDAVDCHVRCNTILWFSVSKKILDSRLSRPCSQLPSRR